MCCKCCKLKATTIFIGILSILLGIAIFVLGTLFPTMAVCLGGYEFVWGLWFDFFGAYFFAIGVLGVFVGIYYPQGLMILFIVLFIVPALAFLGYGAYILNELV